MANSVSSQKKEDWSVVNCFQFSNFVLWQTARLNVMLNVAVL